MKLKRIILRGIPAGLTMGISLFIVGAVAARLVYGPQFVPEGKFEPEQINAWYFLWTKLVFGLFFGLVFTALYEALPLSPAVQLASLPERSRAATLRDSRRMTGKHAEGSRSREGAQGL